MSHRARHLDALEHLLGLPRRSIRSVERRANGDYAVVLGGRRLGMLPYGHWAATKRVLRIPRRRVTGYQPRTPYVRPRDQRARRKQNAWRMALWLAFKTDFDTPVVRRALGGDLDAVGELRAAILGAAPPEPEPVFVYFHANNGHGQAAA